MGRALLEVHGPCRGLQNGCISRRTFDPQYVSVMKKVHALAKRCGKAFPYMGMYITQLETGLNQHRDYRNHEQYFNYTINFDNLRERTSGNASWNRLAILRSSFDVGGVHSRYHTTQSSGSDEWD